MNDDNNYNPSEPEGVTAPVLGDFEYEATSAKKSGPDGVAAPVLDDMGYVASTAKKDGPQGVAAPVLDDMETYSPKEKKTKGEPENVTAPVLDDEGYTAKAPASAMNGDDEIVAGFSPEQKAMYDSLPDDKKKQVIQMRKAQLAQKQGNAETKVQAEPVKAPVLDEDNYTPPVKEEKKVETPAPVSAPVLDEAPEPVKYVPKFADEDLEKAKQEGAKRSVSSQLTSSQKDEKESLKMMLELKAERQAEAARKGFIITIVLAIIGVAAAVLFFMFYSGQFFGLSYKEDSGKFQQIMADYSLYVGIAAGLSSVLLITGVSGLKSLASFMFFILSVIQVIPGFFMISQKDGNTTVGIILYAAALLCSLAVFITLSASEAVGLFFKKPKKEYDR